MSHEKPPQRVNWTYRIGGQPANPKQAEFINDIAMAGVEALGSFAEELASRGGSMAGEFPHWDQAAWQRLERLVGRCECETRGTERDYQCPLDSWMLMYHEREMRAAFKNRDSRKYVLV